MNEIDLLELFYQEMRLQGKPHNQIFLSLTEELIPYLQDNIDVDMTLEKLEKLADICIANEWLERTTADPHYNFLSLTPAGLQVVLAREYNR
ncbi:hypothetical protein [Legionella septentrionalis]|uniref:hypothetical protein n=1 Tax=Legionella septentrionalis TaxID=2498109 RepID=UPI000F8D849C|nr:hypothetical protein [Legionella septentrionalis]RUQ97316.1 hypothetical protein ELY11_06620 [Legionella septentrionalis]